MKLPLIATGASVIIAVAALAVVPLVRVHAQADPSPSQLLVIHGFQANSSSPFILQGGLVGNGVWQRLVGPILSNTFATIPAAPGTTFDGAACQVEYSQDRIVAQDGSTIIGERLRAPLRAVRFPGRTYPPTGTTPSWVGPGGSRAPAALALFPSTPAPTAPHQFSSTVPTAAPAEYEN